MCIKAPIRIWEMLIVTQLFQKLGHTRLARWYAYAMVTWQHTRVIHDPVFQLFLVSSHTCFRSVICIWPCRMRMIHICRVWAPIYNFSNILHPEPYATLVSMTIFSKILLFFSSFYLTRVFFITYYPPWTLLLLLLMMLIGFPQARYFSLLDRKIIEERAFNLHPY